MPAKNDSDNNVRLDEKILLQMIRTIPDVMIFLFNKKFRVVMGEGIEMKKFGIDSVGVKRKHFSEIFDDEVCSSLDPMLKVAMDGRKVSHEMLIKNSYYHIQVFPIKENNTIYASMVIFDNITEFKVKAEALRISKLKAEKSNRAKSDFLANISHEIRTPLNTLIGFADQLAKTKLNNKQKKFLNAVRSSSDHLLSIVDETITLSEVEAGEITFYREPFYIKDVLKQVENMVRLKSEEKGIALNIIITQRLNRLLLGDAICLRRILLNLVSNAVKFTREGSVSVTAEIEKEKDNEVAVKIRVTDTGIGIKKSKLKSIFREFTQADEGITRQYGGSGLGLTIAKKLVKLQNGTISVESEPGKGSEFTVIIPYNIALETRIKAGADDTINTEILAEKKILLVDDDEMNRLLAATIFDSWNLEYDLAMDGYQALDKIRKHHYDIFLFDIHMPGMSGMELANRVREIYKNHSKAYSIIAMTANAIEKDLKKFINAGMDGYLLKPFKEKDLFDTLVKYLSDKSFHENTMPSPKNDHKDQGKTNLYNLSELESTTRGNKFLFNEMIHVFIDNATNNLKQMNQHLRKSEWDDVGETAHKMIPSYRHLQIHYLADMLEKIEDFSLRKKDFKCIPDMIETINDRTGIIIEEIKKEIKKV